MFYNWEQLRDVSLPGCKCFDLFMNLHDYEDTDRKLTDAALAHIAAEKPDCVFLYLGQTDEAGHADGWLSEFYLQTLSNAWECIRRVAEATAGEYDLIITADHGGHDRTHGTLEAEDMTIPQFYIGERFDAGKELEDISILDTAPTIADIMGVPFAPEWEGKSLAR